MDVQVRRGREQRSLALANAAEERPSSGATSPDHAPAAGPGPLWAGAARRGAAACTPWTIPNAIGFVRIALIGPFLALALSSGDGRSTPATILFAVIAWSDYLDELAAHITGQYDRLGTLLDPLTDRLLVISGAIVAWEFELLPRVTLAVLGAREALMLLLTRMALRRGLDIEINTLGRWASGPRCRPWRWQ